MEEKKTSAPKVKLHNSLRELFLDLWKYLAFCGVAAVLIVMVTSGLISENRLALALIGAACVIFVAVVLYANCWTYGDRDATTFEKTAYKSFILNYNNFTVIVDYEINGETVTYTIPAGGYVALYHAQEGEA